MNSANYFDTKIHNFAPLYEACDMIGPKLREIVKQCEEASSDEQKLAAQFRVTKAIVLIKNQMLDRLFSHVDNL
jgi:hypothetical protein